MDAQESAPHADGLEAMSPINEKLAKSFAEDHAMLEKAFREIALHLDKGRLKKARAAASRIDRDAGAHIAFEEHDFYPALVDVLGQTAVSRLRREHQGGLEIVKRLAALPATGALEAKESQRLIDQAKRMEHHVCECGQLFLAMSRLPQAQQQDLLMRLEGWRQRKPKWTSLNTAAV
ncbi:MAG: hemerythrin domain-containing protein [Pseudomonadota bacterium]